MRIAELKMGQTQMTMKEFKNYKKGDSLLYDNAETFAKFDIEWLGIEPHTILDTYKCIYQCVNDIVYVEEIGLEYYNADSSFNFVDGSDFDLAAELDVTKNIYVLWDKRESNKECQFIMASYDVEKIAKYLNIDSIDDFEINDILKKENDGNRGYELEVLNYAYECDREDYLYILNYKI